MRYKLFAYEYYYPSGGLDDIKAESDSLEDLIEIAKGKIDKEKSDRWLTYAKLYTDYDNCYICDILSDLNIVWSFHAEKLKNG